ncbi:putative B3 domain-containing protein REM15 [Euphorbia lathyris]|uniref:putative B3 domain-containing protein REM15 n=1 Tax=Euphorbia lathyris TaxID=212925 RepID=UPI00331387B9
MSATLLTKPHFFKPLLPGFEDDFLIPGAFSKYFTEQNCDKAMLGSRQGGKLWPVKINGRRLEDGWKQFVEDHGLQIGDFLVFRHEGDLVFFVLVFDRTTCEREYPSFIAASTEEEEKIEIEEQNVPEDSSSEKKSEENEKVKTSLEAKASSSVLEYPYSVIQLTPKNIKKSRLNIPRKFARKSGLYGRCCSMILKDEEGNCWPANLLYKRSSGKTYIAGGWPSFCVARKLKTGDLLIVELTRNGKIPVLKIRTLQEHPEVKQEIMSENNTEADSSSPGHLHATTEAYNLEKSQPKIPEEVVKNSGCWKKLEKKKKLETRLEEKASSTVFEHPRCVIELIRDSFKCGRVYIPRGFAKQHGLYGRCCSMILKDGEGNCWPAKLFYKSSTGKTYVGGAWKSFRLAHKLKIGDSLLVELTRNGKIPVLKMQRLQEHPEVKQEVMDQNNAETDSWSPRHLHATTEASNRERTQLHIPEEVTKVSGLGKLRKNKQPVTGSRFFVAKVYDRWVDSKLYIPGKFVRLHFQNIEFCKVILIDREGRSWPANLRYRDSDDQAYISGGWNEFRVANDLNPGDTFVFEFIKKGERPALKMCEFKTNHNARKNEETASSTIEKPSHFFVILKSSMVQLGQIRIPTDFARRNGLLTSVCSEMIIRNEMGNSWQVATKLDKSGEVFIRYGWTEFAKRNGIKVGDVFMLELVKGEPKTRVMNYYAAKQRMESSNQEGMGEDFEDVKPII